MMGKNSIKDALLGFAVGDAIGVPVEFVNRNKLKEKSVSDMYEFGTHKQPIGTWSDDTSMTIATMDSIIEKDGIDYNDIMNKFVCWVRNSDYTATGVFFDIGITTNNALDNYMHGYDPLKCGEDTVRSNGNGSLMRILPFVFYSYYKDLSYDEEVELINNASSLTHSHDISKLGCKIYSDFIKGILDGASVKEAYNNLSNYDYAKYYDGESISYYKRVLNGELLKSSEDEIKSSGFVVSSLEACIWANLKATSYKDAVLLSVNLGDDTDTIGAITGSIAGIVYGSDSIPKHWLANLKRMNYLEYLSDSFTKTIIKINNHSS